MECHGNTCPHVKQWVESLEKETERLLDNNVTLASEMLGASQRMDRFEKAYSALSERRGKQISTIKTRLTAMRSLLDVGRERIYKLEKKAEITELTDKATES